MPGYFHSHILKYKATMEFKIKLQLQPHLHAHILKYKVTMEFKIKFQMQPHLHSHNLKYKATVEFKIKIQFQTQVVFRQYVALIGCVRSASKRLLHRGTCADI